MLSIFPGREPAFHRRGGFLDRQRRHGEDLHVLMSPGNMASAPRYIQVLKGTMTLFDNGTAPIPTIGSL